MIKFECPYCGNGIKVNDSAAGKSGKCNQCGEKVRVPEATQIIRNTPEIVRSQEVPSHYQNPQPVPYQQPPQIASPNVSVNIQQESRAANSMGIASVILGVLAFLLCWIPFVNILAFILGSISALLAVIGLFLGISRKGSGIGYSIAGGALSAIALFFSVGFFLALFGSAAAVSQAVDAANQERIKRQAMGNAPAVVAEGNEPKQAAPAIMNQENKPADKWVGTGLVATAGDVTVEIMGTDINTVQFLDFRGEVEGTSKEEFLLVKLKITNNSDVKKHGYTPWESGRFGKEPILVDEYGNDYTARSPSLQRIAGQVRFEDIYPGKSVEDLYVFDRPVDKASKFKMNLYGRDFTDMEPLLLKFACSKQLIADAKSQSQSSNKPPEKPVMSSSTKQAEPAKVYEFKTTAAAGGFTAEIVKAAIEKRDGMDCLAVQISLKNNSGSSHTYSPWQSKYYSSGDILTDNLGNAYESLPVELDPQKIESGATIEDTLYFEKPDPKASKFNLFLYPRTFTERQPLTFIFKLENEQ